MIVPGITQSLQAAVLAFRVGRLGQQIQGVGQNGEQNVQALFDRFGVAGQVDDEGAAANPRHSP